MKNKEAAAEKGLTLRTRLTLAVVLVMSLACVAITLYMTYAARQYFTRIALTVPMRKIVLSQPAQLSETVENFQAESAGELLEESTIDLKFTKIPASLVSAANELPVVFDSRRNFLLQSMVVMLAAIIGGAGLTYLLTGKALRPLRELSRATKSVGVKNLGERVTALPSPDEVGELSRSFNVMMDRLEQSFTAEKRFSGNAAHELKTPLATMKTSLQVLTMDSAPTNEEYAEFVGTVGKCVDRMICTVESLLELSSESCEMTDHVELVTLLKAIVGEASAKLAEQAISTTVAGEALTLTVSEPLLHRAFSNIVENAIKYNRPSGRIEIGVAQTDGMAEVIVRDSGRGIPLEDRAHVFEAFYRADKSHSQQIPGFGLGLAIVKVILEKHGGTVAIESGDNGTTVIMRLPLQREI